MTTIVAKYMASLPREASNEATPAMSPPTTAAEMTYRIVKTILDELPLPERIDCLRRLSKDIFDRVIP